jgi:hypothetical protein
MNTDQLGTYLNDHLAGSEAGLQLIARLAEDYPDTEFADGLRSLHAEIEEDQQELKRLLERVADGGSTIKQAAGWVAEKLTRLKLGLKTAEPLALFEALEALSLGILGKRALWRGLAVIAADTLDVGEINLADLERRALDQWERVEGWRLNAAERAFTERVGDAV